MFGRDEDRLPGEAVGEQRPDDGPAAAFAGRNHSSVATTAATIGASVAHDWSRVNMGVNDGLHELLGSLFDTGLEPYRPRGKTAEGFSRNCLPRDVTDQL